MWKLLITPDLLLSVAPPTDGIVSTLRKRAGPASKLLRDQEELEKFISDFDASIIGESLSLWVSSPSEKWKNPAGT